VTLMKTIIKPLLPSSLIIGSVLFSAFAFAAPSVNDVQTVRLKATDAMTSFYMYSGLEADSKYATRIDLDVDAITAAMARIKNDVETNEERILTDALSSAWDEFLQLMNTNRKDVIARGYPDVRMVDDMGDACVRLTDAAQALQISAASTPAGSHPAAPIIRDLAYQMANITAQYTARGTSNLGQVFVGYHKKTPSEMADRFDTLLNNLDSSVSGSDQRTVQSIRSKWAFLRRSIDNYNENSVPFLVLNYNDSIISSLNKLNGNTQRLAGE